MVLVHIYDLWGTPTDIAKDANYAQLKELAPKVLKKRTNYSYFLENPNVSDKKRLLLLLTLFVESGAFGVSPVTWGRYSKVTTPGEEECDFYMHFSVGDTNVNVSFSMYKCNVVISQNRIHNGPEWEHKPYDSLTVANFVNAFYGCGPYNMRLAFVMGTHTRLGEASAHLNAFPEEILRTILYLADDRGRPNEHRLAFAMGTHPRLGADSNVFANQTLQSKVLHMIMCFVDDDNDIEHDAMLAGIL